MRLNISIIIPTYNERENIGLLIHEIKKNISDMDEIIVVDDDSPDRTHEVVQQLAKADARVRLIRRFTNRGLVSALSDGIRHAKNDAVLWMDSDLSMPPSKIPELVVQLSEYDIAVGSRYVQDGKDDRGLWLHGALSYGLNRCCSFLFTQDITDWTSGFVCARKSVLETMGLNGFYGEYCIDLLYRSKLAGYTVKEIPYICINRVNGSSKTITGLFGFLKTGWRYLRLVFRLKTSRI